MLRMATAFVPCGPLACSRALLGCALLIIAHATKNLADGRLRRVSRLYPNEKVGRL